MDRDAPRYEERGRPRVQPGYPVFAAFAAVGAVGLGALGLETGGTGALAAAAVLAVVAVTLGLPTIRGRTYTVVAGGTLGRGVAPGALDPGGPTTIPLDRIASCEVVDEPPSLSPDDGDDGSATGEHRGIGWPVERGTLPARPGVVVELEDGRRPRFPAVLPGPGIRGPFTVGRGPPGFLPSDRPEELAATIRDARTGTAGSGPARATGADERDARDSGAAGSGPARATGADERDARDSGAAGDEPDRQGTVDAAEPAAPDPDAGTNDGDPAVDDDPALETE